MASDLVIDWEGGDKTEVIPLGSHRLMRDYWRPLAGVLGLELVPHFYSFCPVEPADLDPLLAELDTFRSELVRQGGYEESIEKVDQLSDAFRRLKQSEGWSASIG